MPQSDADLDDMLAEPERPGSRECHVCWALGRLEPTTAEKMRAVLARTDITPERVPAAIAARLDFEPGEWSVNRHRAKRHA